MKMHRTTLFLSLFLLPAMLLRAQDGSGPDKEFADAVKRGDKAYDGGGLDIDQALVAYEQALALQPENAEVLVKIGLCHLNGAQRHESLTYFRKAAELAPDMPRVHFLLGFALQLNGEWDAAITAFEEHKKRSLGIPDPEPMYNRADRYIAECRNGRSLSASPVPAEVALVPGINSAHADYGPLPTADGSTLYFTSRRAGTTGGKRNKVTNEYFEDIYASTLDRDKWTTPAPLPEPLNSKGNDATLGLSADGSTMLVFRDGPGMGDIHRSTQVNGVWGAPEPLEGLNTKLQESSAWTTADGQWTYFVSDRGEEGLGGQDIYRSRWIAETNSWGPAENLGPDVNSSYDEEGVFVTPDGNTIYFSSKGHTTMGGYDIFRSTFTDGRWSRPENLGWPINSADDDLFFVLMPDGSTGYFCSVRPGGLGMDDIYRVEFTAPQHLGQAR